MKSSFACDASVYAETRFIALGSELQKRGSIAVGVELFLFSLVSYEFVFSRA